MTPRKKRFRLRCQHDVGTHVVHSLAFASEDAARGALRVVRSFALHNDTGCRWRVEPRPGRDSFAGGDPRGEVNVGDHAYVRSGPHCGANGRVDFIDVAGRRALVDFGDGRRGGLTWVSLEWLGL